MGQCAKAGLRRCAPLDLAVHGDTVDHDAMAEGQLLIEAEGHRSHKARDGAEGLRLRRITR